MDTTQDILHAVAEGTLDPETAGQRLAALRASTEPAAASAEPITQIAIKAGAARLVVMGDPDVAEAVAEGPHRMERQDGTLLITTNAGEGDYSTTPPRSALLQWLTTVVDRAGQTLTVRVNPALPIRVLVVGGSLDLHGVSAGASVGVEAGAARLSEGSGPLQLDVVSGSARVDWVFSGTSSVRADMGSAQVTARPGSDARITAEASLGQASVRTDQGMLKAAGDAATPEVVAGSGTGTLHAAARMGSVQVTVV
jgi:hypothetical protein